MSASRGYESKDHLQRSMSDGFQELPHTPPCNIPVKNKPLSFFEEVKISNIPDCLHEVSSVRKREGPGHEEKILVGSVEKFKEIISKSLDENYVSNVPENRSSKKFSAGTSNKLSGYRPDQIFFFKKFKELNSPMIPLEAVCGAFYKFLVPNNVSTTRAHYNEKHILNGSHPYFAVSSKGIPDFKSISTDPLTDQDLNVEEIVKGLALGLTASYIFEEDDLHRGNMDKYGMRIDFDMSLWSILYHFKMDWTFRNPEDRLGDRFIIHSEDIIHFPNLMHARPFYFPTNDPSKIPSIFLEAFEKATGYKASKNSFTPNVIAIFKKLEHLEIFKYYKFRTLLKYVLSDAKMYRNMAKFHTPEILKNTDNKDVEIHCFIERHQQKRINEFRKILIQTNEFKDFLEKDGERALKEIQEELVERNKKLENKIKKLQVELKRIQEIQNDGRENPTEKSIIKTITRYNKIIIKKEIIHLRYESIFADTMLHAAEQERESKFNEYLPKFDAYKKAQNTAKTDTNETQLNKLKQEHDEAKNRLEEVLKKETLAQKKANDAARALDDDAAKPLNEADAGLVDTGLERTTIEPFDPEFSMMLQPPSPSTQTL